MRLDELKQELADLARELGKLAQDLPNDVQRGDSTGDWSRAQEAIDALARGVARAGVIQAEIDDLE